MQEKGCRALWDLATTDNRIKIADAGGIADVLAAMRAHRLHARVQQYGCSALGNLAVNADNSVKIADAGGITDVLAAMRAHKSNAEVQGKGCLALWDLATTDIRIKIADAGGIADVLAAMRAHQSNAELRSLFLARTINSTIIIMAAVRWGALQSMLTTESRSRTPKASPT